MSFAIKSLNILFRQQIISDIPPKFKQSFGGPDTSVISFVYTSAWDRIDEPYTNTIFLKLCILDGLYIARYYENTCRDLVVHSYGLI